jgi:TnpA family transposase
VAARVAQDGQRFKTGGHAEARGQVNPKYGSEPGVQFYTHVSDQYAPFYTTVINVGVRDATFVLDGLLYHESDLRIEEHYPDTAGFTDHVFALMHLLGFRFAPRIRDLADKRLFVPGRPSDHPALAALIGGTINAKVIRAHWEDIVRLATAIHQGTVTASLMLRKLGSYPRQNGLAVALREVGRIERSLFTLDWLQHVELRRRVQAGLNKGEARNALARAVFFNRLGEMRDRSFENQRYRASGLTLLTAAIVLWNTVYLERAVRAIRDHGQTVDPALLQHLSPLGCEHINLTGDYVWRLARRRRQGNSAHYAPSQTLNVLYSPFREAREATPERRERPRHLGVKCKASRLTHSMSEEVARTRSVDRDRILGETPFRPKEGDVSLREILGRRARSGDRCGTPPPRTKVRDESPNRRPLFWCRP